jgi:RNA polymerase sigma-70 factor (ECF subfamily)
MRRGRQDDDEMRLVERLRAGDEDAFAALVSRHHGAMVRLAATYVPNRAVAEEVVQDTWLGVVRGVERFEGRSSLRTWLLRILVNRARTAGARERRLVPVGTGEPAVDPSRFDEGGVWSEPPAPWADAVDDRLAAADLAGELRAAFDDLPALQRQVVALRDVDGLTSREVCEVLEISEGNQRVLLHRGRSRLRRALETAQERI